MRGPRFKSLLEGVKRAECRVLADIGTDHAYVPITAIRRKLCKKAIACDISPGPLGIAKKNVLEAGLTDLIETRLGDGLDPLRVSEADTIVIAGMGGMAIAQILETGLAAAKGAKLILQPQHDLEELRRRLGGMGLIISCEAVSREGGRFYVVIMAEAGAGNELSERECFVGLGSGKDWDEYLDFRAKKIQSYIGSISDERDLEKAKQKLDWLLA